MPAVNIPNRPAGTDPRSIAAILANFDALTTFLNGGNLGPDNLANDSVGSLEIVAGAVTNAKLDAAVQRALFQPGDVKYTAKTAVPAGWLAFHGQTGLTEGAYPDLYAVAVAERALANPLFPVAAAGLFDLADLRGRAPIGAGTGSGLTARALGALVGAETHTLQAAESGVPAHSHAASVADGSLQAWTRDGATNGSPAHVNRGEAWTLQCGVQYVAGANEYQVQVGRTLARSVSVSNNGAAAAGSPHANMQPSAALTVLVKT